MAKKTLVTLQVNDTEWKQDFGVEHAERLLALANNGGWHLPADSNYTFDKENGITRKRTEKQVAEATEAADAAKGAGSSSEN